MDISKYLDNFIESLKDRYVSMIFSALVLLLLANIYRSIWGFVFTVLLSYLIAHLFSSHIITGKSGIVQFPFSGSQETRNKGHGYLVFLVSIIITTSSSSLFADMLIKWIDNNNTWAADIASNFILVGLVFADFHTTYYERERTKQRSQSKF